MHEEDTVHVQRRSTEYLLDDAMLIIWHLWNNQQISFDYTLVPSNQQRQPSGEYATQDPTRTTHLEALQADVHIKREHCLLSVKVVSLSCIL